MRPMREVVRGQGGRVPDRVAESFDEVLSAAQAGAGWAAGRLWASLAAPGHRATLNAEG